MGRRATVPYDRARLGVSLVTALAPSRLKGMNQIGRRAFTAALFVYGVYDLSHPGHGGPLDLVDLPIHETGHLVFMAFGEFIHIAGGTLFQLIMPALFLVYFWRRGDKHAASVMLWWIAQNCGNIAVYAADARAQELPLVGGGEHDWANMLGTLGLLAKDQEVARAIRGIGWVLLFVSTAWGLVAAKGSEEVEAELAPDA